MTDYPTLIEKLERSHGGVPCVATAEIRRLIADNEALRKANLDCVDHYNDCRAEAEALRAQVADYETRLSAVMPSDFKDWHQNSKAEWPEVAAWVIETLREQRDEMCKELGELPEAQADTLAECKRLRKERDTAIEMLAEWCVAVDQNGSAWDDWDEHYKNAMYRPNPLRALLDAAIDAQKGKV